MDKKIKMMVNWSTEPMESKSEKCENGSLPKTVVHDEIDVSTDGQLPKPCRKCSGVSVNFAASFAVSVLSAISFVIALSTTNWSASGHQMRMGLWDFCISQGTHINWTCYPVNTDFSVATQSFSILAAMCFACTFVLYFLFTIFGILRRSRPLTIALCLVAFFTVCLQIMSLIVFATKNRELYKKIERDYFETDLDALYISWSYYCACISVILGTVTGVLLFLEFRNLAYEIIYSKPTEQSCSTNVT